MSARHAYHAVATPLMSVSGTAVPIATPTSPGGTVVPNSAAIGPGHRAHHSDSARFTTAERIERSTMPRCWLTPYSTAAAVDCGSARNVGTVRIVSSRLALAYLSPTHVVSRLGPNTIRPISTGQLTSTEYFEPVTSMPCSFSCSPSVSISLAVGDSTTVACVTSERAFSTRPETIANGVTSAGPRNDVITIESVWNAMFEARAPTNAQPLYVPIARRCVRSTRAGEIRTPGS